MEDITQEIMDLLPLADARKQGILLAFLHGLIFGAPNR